MTTPFRARSVFQFAVLSAAFSLFAACKLGESGDNASVKIDSSRRVGPEAQTIPDFENDEHRQRVEAHLRGVAERNFEGKTFVEDPSQRQGDTTGYRVVPDKQGGGINLGPVNVRFFGDMLGFGTVIQAGIIGGVERSIIPEALENKHLKNRLFIHTTIGAGSVTQVSGGVGATMSVLTYAMVINLPDSFESTEKQKWRMVGISVDAEAGPFGGALNVYGTKPRDKPPFIIVQGSWVIGGGGFSVTGRLVAVQNYLGSGPLAAVVRYDDPDCSMRKTRLKCIQEKGEGLY